MILECIRTTLLSCQQSRFFQARSHHKTIAAAGRVLMREVGSKESRVNLASTADIQSAAEQVSSEKSETGRFVAKFSTTMPAVEPHKVYGLADLLENFYRRKLPEARSTLAGLEFCQE